MGNTQAWILAISVAVIAFALVVPIVRK